MQNFRNSDQNWAKFLREFFSQSEIDQRTKYWKQRALHPTRRSSEQHGRDEAKACQTRIHRLKLAVLPE